MAASQLRGFLLAMAVATVHVTWALDGSPACGADGGACESADMEDDPALIQVKDVQMSKGRGVMNWHIIGKNDYSVQTSTSGVIYELTVTKPTVVHFWDPKVIGSPCPQGYEEVAAIRLKKNCVNEADCAQHANPMESYLVTYGGSRCDSYGISPEWYSNSLCQEWYLVSDGPPPSAVPYTPALMQVHDDQLAKRSDLANWYIIGKNDYGVQKSTSGVIYELTVNKPTVVHFWDPKVIGSPCPQGYEEVAAIRWKANCVNKADCAKHPYPKEGYLVTYGGSRCAAYNLSPEFFTNAICQELYLIQAPPPPIAVPFR